MVLKEGLAKNPKTEKMEVTSRIVWALMLMMEVEGLASSSNLSQLPMSGSSYDIKRIIASAGKAVRSAVKDGVEIAEIEFPIAKGNKIDISLGETLDMNREYGRELAREFSAEYGKTMAMVFPDNGEV